MSYRRRGWHNLAIGLVGALAVAGAACTSDDDATDDGTAASTGSGSDPSAPGPVVPDAFTAVIGSTVGHETAPVLGSDGNWHVVYELMLTNAKAVPAAVELLEVLDFDDRDHVLLALDQEELAARERELSGAPRFEPDTPTLPAGPELDANESMIVLIELEFPTRDDVPDTIVHRFTGLAADNPGATEPVPVHYLLTPWRITDRTAAVIGSPLEGDEWVVVNGCCSDGGAHRGAIQTVSGELADSQRFAIDWMKIGPNGRFFDGDPSDLTNWFNYGEPVSAVADGTVVEVLDELDDQEPGTLPDPESITIETVDGNHVILDLGNGVYAFYAHLRRGSVLVEEGDEVGAGDQLGELGNSGNTSGPHLHLHLMNRPSALAADSIPYGFAGAEVTGTVDREQWETSTDALDDQWTILDPPAGVPDQPYLPLDLDVVGFGSG